jgi:DNA-directed RNA polymerase specialized sigma24 family protein
VPAGGDPFERAGEAELVRRALGELSERDREALLLIAWEGLDPARAAQVAGCSRATFAVRLHRARKRLDRTLFALEFPLPDRTQDVLEVR